MIKFSRISQIEHAYHFEDAATDADVLNGAFGAVLDGKFAVAAGAMKAIMQVENGDDANMPKYKIAKGAHVRVVDLEAFAGELVEIYDYPLPATFVKGDKLVSDADGALIVDTAASETYLEITRIIGQRQGVEVKVVKN